MPVGDVSGGGVFGRTLSVGTRRWSAFSISVACHGLALGAILLFWIVPDPERLTRKPPAYVEIMMPTKPLEAPAVKPPKPTPKLRVPKIQAAKIHVPVLPPPKPVPPPEEPKVAAQIPPMKLPPLPARRAEAEPPTRSMPVRTGVLGSTTQVATVKLPARAVQTGGFGSPNGLPGQALGGSPGNVPKLGSFDLPSGGGYGNGTGGSKGARGTVASAGFGSAVAGGAGGDGGGESRGEVRPGAFDVKPAAQPPAPQRSPAPKPEIQPVEILSKPNPQYTEEARRLGVEGEVVLSVVFSASGKIEVRRVIRGLGHGLDEAAWRAAEKIRFKPAERDGQPVDFPATLRVVFQLANQTKPSGDQS